MLGGTEEECSYSPGSVKTVKVARAEEVESVPVLDGENPVTQRPVAYFPTSFITYHFRPDSVIFSESGEQTSSGLKYKQRVRAFHPGTDSGPFFEIARLMDGHYILIIELYSGPILLLGNKENPFLFRSDFTSGEKLADIAGSTWEFLGESNAPPPTLADIEVTTASPCSLLSSSDWLYQPWEINTGSNYQLEKIYVDANPGGLITTIDSRPDGTLYDNNNNAVDTLVWNAGGWYEPQAGPHTIVGSWRAIITLPVTTGSPATSCNHTFNQQFTLANSPPTLNYIGWFEPTESGETLVSVYLYADADGDGNNTAATNASLEWFQADDASGTNEVSLGTSLSYTVVLANEGKYIELRGTPYALAGAPQGPEARSGWVLVPISNTAPVASNLTLDAQDGILTGITSEVMQGITGTYTVDIADPDLDTIDATNAVKIYIADDQIETNLTLLSTITPSFLSGNTYTFDYLMPSGHSNKYLFVKVTAFATPGVSPGNTISINKPVIPQLEVVLSVETSTDDISGSLFKVAIQNTKKFYLKKINDVADPNTYSVTKITSALGQPEQLPVVFATNGQPHRLEIWGYPNEFYSLHANGYSFTSIVLHANCTLKNTTQAGWFITNQAALTVFTIPTANNPGDLTVNMSGVTYTGAFNIANWDRVSNFIVINCNFSSITYPTSTHASGAGLSIFELNNCDNLTGDQDFSGFKFALTITRIYVIWNAAITGCIWPAITDSYTISNLHIYMNAALIRYGIDNLVVGGYVRLHFNSNATDFGTAAAASVALTGAANAVTSLELEDHVTTQNLDISDLDYNTANNKFIQDNNLGTITWPSSFGGLAPSVKLNNNNLDTNIPLASAFTNLLNDNNFRLEIKDTTIPAANFNEFLVNFEALSNGSATGRVLDIIGTPYDTTSGGFNGTAAISSLNSKGWSVIT